MNMILSLKIEKGFFYFLMAISGMIFFIAAPGVINYFQLHWQVLSPIVCLNFMLIGFFLTIYFSNKKAPEDIDKQKITPYDNIYKLKLIKLLSRKWDEIKIRIKDTFKDSLRYNHEIYMAFENFSNLICNDCLFMKEDLIHRLQKEKEDETSLSLSHEYFNHLFTKVGTPIEIKQLLWAHLQNFIKYGTVPTDKNLNIPYNKKLRNVELINFIQDIVEMNHLEHQNYELFLKAVFPEWFTGDMTNIASNANRRVKNPLVTNEGWEINLKRLRDPSFKGVK